MLKITRFGNDDVVVKELLGDRFAAVRESHHLYLYFCVKPDSQAQAASIHVASTSKI